MALYFISPKGESEFSAEDMLARDKTLTELKPSFFQKFFLTPDNFFRLFLGGNPDYSYLTEYVSDRKIPFAAATHPEITYSCTDKINMLNEHGCAKNLSYAEILEKDLSWGIEDTIKAVIFLDKHRQTYHMAIVPGKPSYVHVDTRSFNKVLSNNYNVTPSGAKKRIRFHSSKYKPLFDFGQEGCFTPIPPLSSKDQIDAIYFDKDYLEKYKSIQKLDDLSISFTMIKFPPRAHITQKISKEYVKGIKQLLNGTPKDLTIKNNNGLFFADIEGMLEGEHRDALTKPKNNEPGIELRFSYLPNHRLSALMPHTEIYKLLEQFFPNKVFKIDMKYE